METGEGHHVDSQLTQVCVQLSRESQAGGDTWVRRRDGEHSVLVFLVFE